MGIVTAKTQKQLTPAEQELHCQRQMLLMGSTDQETGALNPENNAIMHRPLANSWLRH